MCNLSDSRYEYSDVTRVAHEEASQTTESRTLVMNNATPMTEDRNAYLKIVVASLIAAIFVVAAGIAAWTTASERTRPDGEPAAFLHQ